MVVMEIPMVAAALTVIGVVLVALTEEDIMAMAVDATVALAQTSSADSSNAGKVKARKLKELAAHGKKLGETREPRLFGSQKSPKSVLQEKLSSPRSST